MASVSVPPPPFNQAFLDGAHVSTAWRLWLQTLFRRIGGTAQDKVDAAYVAALGAAAAKAQVIGTGGLQGGGALGGNVGLALYASISAVASLPAGVTDGDWAYAVDGRKPGEGAGAGTGVPCFWSNGHWVAATSGAPVTS